MLGSLVESSGGARVLADKMVAVFGEKRAALGLGIASLFMGFPMFFDAGLIVMLPIVFAVARRIGGKHMLLYGISAAAALSVMHVFVPPHPGPITSSEIYGANLGLVLLLGIVIALPTWYLTGYLWAQFINKRIPLAVMDLFGGEDVHPHKPPKAGTVIGILAIPLVLICLNTGVTALASAGTFDGEALWVQALQLIGTSQVALLIAVLVALFVLGRLRGESGSALEKIVDSSLGPICSVVLITGAGGMFGGVLGWCPLSELFDLTGRTALVTGSSRGLGQSLASGLASAGAVIVVHGRDQATVDASAAHITETTGAHTHTVVFDVTDAGAVEDAIGELAGRVGVPDILVNNAGIQRRAPIDQFSIADWDEVIATNLSSAFYVSRFVAPGMIERGSGKIINIASVQSMLARQTIAPYSASKGGIAQLSRGMAADLARHGIQVNTLSPGYFATEMNAALVADEAFTAWVSQRTPAGRWGNVEELRGPLVFLASAASDFVSGQNLFVDGGMTAVV